MAAFFILAAGIATAQRWGGGGWGGGRWRNSVYETCRTAREAVNERDAFPSWTNEPGFDRDAFTFVRVRCGRTQNGSRSSAPWWTDFPESDLNLAFRLHQMTSMKVNPDGRVLNLTDKDLPRYPFIYMVEPGRLLLEDEEVAVLRRYLDNGGVLMADDFWGEVQWQGFQRQMKRVFPNRDFKDLPMDHPVFHCVIDLKCSKNELQIPNVNTGIRSQYPPHITWEYHDGEECREVHIRALMDDQDRIMVLACHNTDNGDGWEREGDDEYYFHEFSEKKAYPLIINILFYIMTH